jgi:aldehyde dehydrogenase (NAD+)
VNTYDELFIAGRWVEPSGDDVIEVVSPHDGALVGRVPHATHADVDAAVAAAREAFESGCWSGLPLEERLSVLRRMSELLTERIPELATLITRQNGSRRSRSARVPRPECPPDVRSRGHHRRRIPLRGAARRNAR